MEALLDNLSFALFVVAQILAIVAVPAMRFDNGYSEPRPRRARRGWRAGSTPATADL